MAGPANGQTTGSGADCGAGWMLDSSSRWVLLQWFVTAQALQLNKLGAREYVRSPAAFACLQVGLQRATCLFEAVCRSTCTVP